MILGWGNSLAGEFAYPGETVAEPLACASCLYWSVRDLHV